MAYLTPTRHPLSSREDGLYSDYADEVRSWAKKEIEMLQKENKKLKETVQEGVSVCQGAKESMEEMFDKIEELEKEKKELKEDAKKIEEVIRLVGNQETIYGCNKIWYECCPSDDEEDEQYMFDVKDENTTYYLGDDLDEARKHSQVSGVEIKRYIVEDGEPNFDDWDVVH